jgi:YidC/Oxa1 family membrane protein insertase
MIQAMLLTVLLLFGWQLAVNHFWPTPPPKPKPAASSGAPAQVPVGSGGASALDPAPAKPGREGGLTSAVDAATETRDLKADLASGARVPIAAPGLSGSINLAGGVLDDLVINRHRATLAKDSGPERIFSPKDTPAVHFAQMGWVGTGAALPDANTVYQAPAGAKLTPQTPVTLSWSNPAGQTFTLTYAIDADYMITVTEGLANHGPAPVTARPFALIERTQRTASVRTFQIHSGPFGAFDDKVTFAPKYDEVQTAGQMPNAGKPDWLGFTDIYWMSVLVPEAKATASSVFRSLGNQLFRADLVYDPVTIAPGQQVTRTTRLFAGAKEANVLDRYEDAGIPHFGLAIDWGWFRWFEKPIFLLLDKLFHATGNFGLAIILLTVIVRGIMFPIAQRQFKSMAGMRAVQPKLKALQERLKDDKPKLQQETMELYKAEGVNPLAGCLPMVVQIPVFFALYKVLTVSIEMRHQPFALWIKDLSEPDPLHIFNLFGLIPWTPPSLLGIGILALILGGTMWLQFRLQPAAPDPSQQQVMAIMPWMMMFVMAPFAAGLLVYWITTNLLVIGQQAFLYSRHPQMRAMIEKEREDVKAAARASK